MNRDKYSEDYRLRDDVVNGRPRQTAEYIGEYYRFQIPGVRRRSVAARLLAFCIVGIVACILPVSITNHLSAVIYAVIPHLLTAIPLWLLIASLMRIRFGKEPMIHEHADKAAKYFAIGAPSAVLTAGLAALGDVVWVVSHFGDNTSGGDLIFVICDIIMLLAGIYCLLNRSISEVAIIRDNSSDAL